ncbi:hypothetical protein GCM10028832_12070 [Streptomyces sparsus]
MRVPVPVRLPVPMRVRPAAPVRPVRPVVRALMPVPSLPASGAGGRLLPDSRVLPFS